MHPVHRIDKWTASCGRTGTSGTHPSPRLVWPNLPLLAPSHTITTYANTHTQFRKISITLLFLLA